MCLFLCSVLVAECLCLLLVADTSQEAWHLLHDGQLGQLPNILVLFLCSVLVADKLGTCSTTDALSPRTLLTENICESVQQILQHSPAKRKRKKKVQLTKDNAFVYWSSSCAVCWWPIFRKLGTCSTTDALSPRTLLTENICESVQKNTPT